MMGIPGHLLAKYQHLPMQLFLYVEVFILYKSPVRESLDNIVIDKESGLTAPVKSYLSGGKKKKSLPKFEKTAYFIHNCTDI